MAKRNLKKWTLGAYSRGSGMFTDVGKYDTPMAACEAAGKKAWVWDSELDQYVLYDPVKHAEFNRVDCGRTPAEAYNFYHAAFRETCPRFGISWASAKNNGTHVEDNEHIFLKAGERIQFVVNQDVQWDIQGLTWGERGINNRTLILVSYNPNETVTVTMTNDCGDSKIFRITFLINKYEDAATNDDSLNNQNANDSTVLKDINTLVNNIWGQDFVKQITGKKELTTEDITPELVDLVQTAADEITYQSQGVLIADITYNFFLTGIPQLAQFIFSVLATVSTDYYNDLIQPKNKHLSEQEKEKLAQARDAFTTYKNWFHVYEKKRAHQSVINTVALKYKAELTTLLVSQ